jgi:beta-fructofuranosidase
LFDFNIVIIWHVLQAIPRSIWLDKSRKQLVQWPISELERLRENQVNLPNQVLKGGLTLEVSGVTSAQVNFLFYFIFLYVGKKKKK